MKKIIGVIGMIVIAYYALHSTPSMAVRTALFFEGHPSVAFSGGVTKEKDVKKKQFQLRTKLYMVRKKNQSTISFRM